MTGKVIRVIDGDTVAVQVSGKKEERIRLDGIDAPERGQDFSEKSRKHLASLVMNRTVRIEYKDRDVYGRILGVIYADSLNVNEDMLRQGLAWQYRSNKNPLYLILQEQAKAKRLNIWSRNSPVDPYDYRRGRRN